MVGVKVFANAFSPFAVKRRGVTRHTLPVFSGLIVTITVDGLGRTDRRVSGHMRSVEGIFPGRYTRLMSTRSTSGNCHLRIITCSSLAVSLTRHLKTEFLIHNIHSTGSFRCRQRRTSVGGRLNNMRAVLLFSSPECDDVDSALIERLEFFKERMSRFLPGVGWG